MKLTTISFFLLACLSLNAQVLTQYLQGLTSPVQANIDSRVLDTGDTMTGNLRFSGTTIPGLVPNNLTAIQIGNLVAPPVGSTLFNTTSGKLNMWDGSLWNELRIGNYVRITGDTMTGPLVIQGGAVVASTPVLDLSQTWNLAGTTFTGLKFNVTDSASANGSLLFDFEVGGVSKIYGSKVGNFYVSGGSVVFGSTPDTILSRGAANTLDLRNLANAQTWNVYGTTDAGLLNYRRIRSTMTTGGAATIAAEGLGTGVSGNTLEFTINGLQAVLLSGGGTPSMTVAGTITSTGGGATINANSSFIISGRVGMYATASGSYVFGNSSATDADIFLKLGVNTSAAAGIKRQGTTLQIRLNDDSAFAGIQPLSVAVPISNGFFGWTGGSYISSQTDGIIRLNNAAGTGFTRLQFGGDTASYPALRRTTTNIEAVLADNSDWAGFQSRYARISSGSPEGVVSAPVGAVFHRIDGGAGTSFYVKESGSGNTGWVAK